eukprot:TRINITY_DN5025_c0_g1_i1.p1 TRINITY_DN5025_c0_g1~~TRINITY_DN5025_c0_g1_i1.p1  ORF type:complete len:104 (-),score=32.65 TRINITY_DN5025_c0_g1_i1:82-393(-)
MQRNQRQKKLRWTTRRHQSQRSLDCLCLNLLLKKLDQIKNLDVSLQDLATQWKKSVKVLQEVRDLFVLAAEAESSSEEEEEENTSSEEAAEEASGEESEEESE